MERIAEEFVLSSRVSVNPYDVIIYVTNFKDGHMRLFDGPTTPETSTQDTRAAIETTIKTLEGCIGSLIKEYNKLSK